MALGAANDAPLAVAGVRDGPEGDALVEGDVGADLGGLADDGAGGVVDEEAGADAGAGVNVGAGLGVGPLGHDAGHQAHADCVQLVGEAVDGDGEQARVGENDLVEVGGGRVAVEGGLHVFDEGAAQGGQLLQELGREGAGARAAGRRRGLGLEAAAELVFVAEAEADLAGELVAQRREQHAGVVADVLIGQVLAAEVAGVHELQEQPDDLDDLVARGQKAAVDVVPPRVCAVALDQGLDQLGQFVGGAGAVRGCHGRRP